MLQELEKLVHPNRKLLLVVRSRLPELRELQELTILRPPVEHLPSLELAELREPELEDSYHPSPMVLAERLALLEPELEHSYHPSPALPELRKLPVPGLLRVEEHRLFYCALE